MKATILGALAEPTRLRIVEFLRGGPSSVNEIADKLGLTQPQTSKHLRVLNEAGLVTVQASANRRIYSLRLEPFEQLEHWAETFTRRQAERYEQLDSYLATLEDEE